MHYTTQSCKNIVKAIKCLMPLKIIPVYKWIILTNPLTAADYMCNFQCSYRLPRR